MGRRDRSGIRLQSGGFNEEGGRRPACRGLAVRAGLTFSIAQCQPAAQREQAREPEHRSGARDGTGQIFTRCLRLVIEGLFQRFGIGPAKRDSHARLSARRALGLRDRVVAYNVLAVIQATVEAEHDLAAMSIELSSYFVAGEVKAYYAGIIVAVPRAAWAVFESRGPRGSERHVAPHRSPCRPRALRSTRENPNPRSRRATPHAPRCNVTSRPPACSTTAGCGDDLESGGSYSTSSLRYGLSTRPVRSSPRSAQPPCCRCKARQ